MIIIYGTPVLNNGETITYHGNFIETSIVTTEVDLEKRIAAMINQDIAQTDCAYITHAVNVNISINQINTTSLLICITGNYAHVSK